jgi:mono/diheme cytochrome c family protein
MKTKWIVSLFALSFVLAACGAGANSAPTLPTVEEPQPISIPTLTPAPVPSATAADASAEPAAPETASVSFANDVKPIFSASCVNCHGGDQMKAGLDLKTYESLMAGSMQGAVIFPGSPNQSVLIQQVAEGEMPKRGDKLTAEQVQLISDWVAAGAPNN